MAVPTAMPIPLAPPVTTATPFNSSIASSRKIVAVQHFSDAKTLKFALGQ
jgi:hypothetical protein